MKKKKVEKENCDPNDESMEEMMDVVLNPAVPPPEEVLGVIDELMDTSVREKIEENGGGGGFGENNLDVDFVNDSIGDLVMKKACGVLVSNGASEKNSGGGMGGGLLKNCGGGTGGGLVNNSGGGVAGPKMGHLGPKRGQNEVLGIFLG